MTGEGRLAIHGDSAVLTFERWLPHPVETVRMTGRILVWDPPNILEHEWKQAIVEDGVVRYELRQDGDGTLLRFTHRGLGPRTASGFLGGTHAYLDRMEAYLAGDELPDWTTRRQEIITADQESK